MGYFKRAEFWHRTGKSLDGNSSRKWQLWSPRIRFSDGTVSSSRGNGRTPCPTEAIEAQKKALTYNQADNVIYGLAQRYAQAGDVANALENLREAIAQNPRWKAVAARNTSFDKIKDHPEFKALIERE